MGALKEEPWINLTMAGQGIYNRLVDTTLPLGFSLSYRLVYFELDKGKRHEQNAGGIEFEWRWTNPLRADQGFKSTFTISKENILKQDRSFVIQQAAYLLAQQVQDMILKMILKK